MDWQICFLNYSDISEGIEIMTNESAHSYMENEIRCVQRASKGICTRDCSKCDLVREDKPLLEAYGLAVLALEKQVAKKPKIKRGQVCDSKVCPSCGSFYIYTANNEKAHYCNTCGQHIDWSED